GNFSSESELVTDGLTASTADVQASMTAGSAVAGHNRYPVHRSGTRNRANSIDVAIPTGAPPRNAHSAARSSSSFASSDARPRWHARSTYSTARRAPDARPYFRMNQPTPPPKV